MYTVAELIETLKQCPSNYVIRGVDHEGFFLNIESVGIDNEDEAVDLFVYY